VLRRQRVDRVRDIVDGLPLAAKDHKVAKEQLQMKDYAGDQRNLIWEGQPSTAPAGSFRGFHSERAKILCAEPEMEQGGLVLASDERHSLEVEARD